MSDALEKPPAGEFPLAEVVFSLPLFQRYSYRIPSPEEGKPLCRVGCRVEAPLGRRKLTGWVVGLSETLPAGLEAAKIRPFHRVVDEQPLFGAETLDTARWISEYYGCSEGEALSAMLPGGRREKETSFLGLDEEITEAPELTLSEEQKRAVETIRRHPGGLFYLYGITGSGKTEVFMRAAQEALDAGQGVIFLVPEISLTHQTLDILAQRFDQPLAVLHSHLTPSQKLKEWRRIQRGEARLVIGARSAIFAPVKDLGLIIIDEEHENSYKSGNTPRYHARQAALYLARRQGARLIMGSATPSLEAWHAMETGTLRRLTLNQRLAGGTLPAIRVVSLLKEPSLLSQPLQEEMRTVLDQGKQVVLFLNRRGFSYFFHCRSCGYEMKCRQCSVSLTYHKGEEMMVCHYCGYRRPPLTSCPDCGSVDVGYSGFGTEHIEEEVRRLFPASSLARLDTDTARKKGALQKTLQSFRRGETSILLGTQMVAKGLNFPGVRLVGILMADMGLGMPDFRAAERTFSLITQVAGRAGRYDSEGRVILQTLKTDHPAVNTALENRFADFYAWEMANRRALGFPPFARLIRLVFRSKSAEAAQQSADVFADFLEGHFPGEAELLGPSECPLGVIGGNHRWHLIVRSGPDDFPALRRMVREAWRAYKSPAGLYVEMDVDPLSLL